MNRRPWRNPSTVAQFAVLELGTSDLSPVLVTVGDAGI
jgi:hypothetical protein